MTAELRLLLASARRLSTEEDGVAIRRTLIDGIDWTLFARETVEQGLAGLVGQTLDRLVPEIVPDELRDAFRANFERTRQTTVPCSSSSPGSSKRWRGRGSPRFHC